MQVWIHPQFETQDRRQKKSKTGDISGVTKNDWCPPYFLKVSLYESELKLCQLNAWPKNYVKNPLENKTETVEVLYSSFFLPYFGFQQLLVGNTHKTKSFIVLRLLIFPSEHLF